MCLRGRTRAAPPLVDRDGERHQLGERLAERGRLLEDEGPQMTSYEEHHAVAQLGEGGLLQLRHRRAHHRRLELEELGEAHLPEEDGALTLTLT